MQRLGRQFSLLAAGHLENFSNFQVEDFLMKAPEKLNLDAYRKLVEFFFGLMKIETYY